jgi:RNA polymerase primary sigma factor
MRRLNPPHKKYRDKNDSLGYPPFEELLDPFPDLDRGRFKDMAGRFDDPGMDDSEDPAASGSSESEPASLETAPFSDDPVSIYLKEMSRVPLLSMEQELDLAIRIEKGHRARRKAESLQGGGPAAARREVNPLIQDGVNAREHLIKANTRLVVSIAKRYMGRGVAFLDLIQEGNLGLMKAVEKYDYKRGFRFSTYATWWIRQSISRAITDQSRTIRVPIHMMDRIRQIYKAQQDLEQKLGRQPTLEEIASATKISVSRVQWIVRVSWTPISLESPFGDEEESELGQFIEDRLSPTPMQSAYESMLKEKVEEVLASLSAREAQVIRLRFGLTDGREYTLEEVGEKFGLTRERIRQIEGKALRQLRHPRRARELKEYL